MLKFSGESPSHLACKNGHLNVMKVLEPYLTFRDPDINGISSLTYACLNGHTEIINLYRNIENNFNKIMKRREIQMKLCKKFKHNHCLQHHGNGDEYLEYCNFINLFKCSKCNRACNGHTPKYTLSDDYFENVEYRFLYSTDSEEDYEGLAAKKNRKFLFLILYVTCNPKSSLKF